MTRRFAIGKRSRLRTERGPIGAAASLMAAAVLLAGCGAASDAHKGNTSTGAPSSAAATSAATSTGAGAANGTPIKVMTIGNWTQPAGGTSDPEFPAGAQAAAQAVNAKGGLNGHPIQVIACSDQLNPNVARTCANQAVSEKVAAVVGLQTSNLGVILPVLQQAGIPAVGVVPFSSAAFTTPDSFSDVGGQMAEDGGTMFALKKAGAHKVAQILPAGLEVSADEAAIRRAAKQNGLQFTRVVEIPPNTSDLSAVIASATAGGVDGLLGFGFDEAAFVQAFRQTAPKVILATTSFNLSPQVMKALGSQANGIYLAPNTVSPSSNTPGATQFRQDLKTYYPQYPPTFTGLHEWMAMSTFAKVMSASKTIDPASVITAYRSIHNMDMGGITPAYSTSPKGSGEFSRMFNRTAYLAVVKNGQFTPLDPSSPFVTTFIP